MTISIKFNGGKPAILKNGTVIATIEGNKLYLRLTSASLTIEEVEQILAELKKSPDYDS